MYNKFLSEDKIYIVFHKSCVDGFFSVFIFLKALALENDISSKNKVSIKDYILYPLSPSDIKENNDKIKTIFSKKKVILDLEVFGTNIIYFFDHHITNEEVVSEYASKSSFNGVYDKNAASTCELLLKYFGLEKDQPTKFLTLIANRIDQANFKTPPPVDLKIKVSSEEEIIWACNDLLKSIKHSSTLIELLDSFEIDSLAEWLIKNQKYIISYRNIRKKTLDLLPRIEYNPIIIISTMKYNIQAESIHFMYSATKKDYIMFILIQRLKSKLNTNKAFYRISFRLNPNLSDELTEKYRVDKIATIFGGGGHRSAASAKIQNYQKILTKTIKWVDLFDKEYTEQIFN